MANFINKIKIGATTYDIGMQSAIHFEGVSLISNWYVDAACKTVATEAKLTESQGYLYSNKATIIGAVEVGCMYIPATGTAEKMAATGYELVCVEYNKESNLSKWAILGQVKKETATGVRAVATAAKAVIIGITPGTANRISSVTPGTASIAAGVATASYNVITATPGTAAVTAQDVISGVSATSTTINYADSLNEGSVTAKHITAAAPVSASVSVTGGGVTVITGTKLILCTEASGKAGKVGITLTNASSTVVTQVSTGTVKQASSSDKATVTVVDGVLQLPATILQDLTGSATVAVSGTTTSISVPSAAAMASNVITAVETTPVTHTIDIVTSATHTNPTVKVTLPTSVVTDVVYTAPTLSTTAQSIVTAVEATGATSIGAVATNATLISSVPYAAKTIATAAGDAKTVVTSVVAGSAATLTGVTVATANVNHVTSVTTGTVVTAVL